MDKFDKYIDDLFEQKLSGASIPDATMGTEWLKIEKVLQKKSFMKFSFAKFNIYYLSTLIAATTIAVSVFLPPILNSAKHEQIPSESQPVMVDSTEDIKRISIDRNSVIIDIDTIKNTIDIEKIETPDLTNEIDRSEIIKKKAVVEKEQAFRENSKSAVQLKPLVKEMNDFAIYNKQHLEILPINAVDTIVVVDTIRIIKKRKILRYEK